MTHFYRKKIVHMILVVLMLFSSLGNSVGVIAETIDSSIAEIETTDGIPETTEEIGEVVEESSPTVQFTEEERADLIKDLHSQDSDIPDVTGELLDGNGISSRMSELMNLDNFWISRFLKGNASGSGRTQFPQTYYNYLMNDSRAVIVWDNGNNAIGSEIGDTIAGTFYLPRQYIYTPNGGDIINSGSNIWGNPVRSDYEFVPRIQANRDNFTVTISEREPYGYKDPVVNRSGDSEGVLADFHPYRIVVERTFVRRSTFAQPNFFTLDVSWILNSYFYHSSSYIHLWHRNHRETLVLAMRTDFTEAAYVPPVYTVTGRVEPPEGSQDMPTFPTGPLVSGAGGPIRAGVPNPGYQFAGFELIGAGSRLTNHSPPNLGANMFIGTEDAVLTARYSLTTQSLTLNQNNDSGSTGSLTADKTSLVMGETTTVRAAPPAPGYRFVGFDVSGVGGSLANTDLTNRTATFTMGSENATVTARYELADQALTLDRNPQAGSNTDPTAGSNTLQMGQETVITAAPALPGYRFSGFSVAGADSTISNVDLTNRTATFRMGSENATVTAEYASTVIRNADELERFLRSEFPYDSNNETYTFEPEANQTIDMAGKGNFTGRSQFSGNLIGNGTTITNLSLTASSAALGMIQTLNGSNQSRIENLTLSRVTVNNTRTQFYSAGLIGQVASGTSIELENIKIDEHSEISASQPYGSAGLIGINNGTATIKNGEVLGTLHASTSNGLMGGIVGLNQGQLTIENSLSRVTFTGNGNFTLNIGGLVGETNGQVTITDSRSESRTGINSASGTHRGGFIARVGNSGNVAIQRSVNSSDMRGTNSYVGGFIGRTSGTVRIEESYHNGHVQGNVSLGTGGFVGQAEGSGTLSIIDGYSVGSSNGNGVLGVNQMTNDVILSQLFIAGFTAGQPITSDTAGITATNVYYDSSTTNKSSTTGVGEAKTTLELIEATTSGLGFGNRWRTDFSVSQRTNKTYPYLSWQTNNTQASMFFNSIDPMVDRPVSGNQVTVTLDLHNQPLRLFNPYSSGLAGETTSGTVAINRGNASNFSIGVINEQGVIGFTARRMAVTVSRSPISGSTQNPEIERTEFLEGETAQIKAAEPNQGYRFVGFSVTGAGSTISNLDMAERTATLTMGTENTVITAEYASTLIRNADDLEKFLRSEFPYDSNDQTYTFEPDTDQTIDMAGKGSFIGRSQFSGNLIGNGTTITNLSLAGSSAALGLIQTLNGSNQSRIENLTLAGVSVNNTRTQFYSAGLIGQVASGTSIELENIQIDEHSQISASQPYGSAGLIGINNGTATIKNGVVLGTLHSNTANGLMGGIIGLNQGQLTIENSLSRVTFTGGGNFTLNIGGLVGETNGQVTITDSKSESWTGINSLSGTSRGGFIARVGNSGDVTIQRSINSSDMRGNNSYIGGFIGRLFGTARIEESYHDGHVEGSTTSGTGAFVGISEGNGTLAILDSYSIGSSNGNGVIGSNQMNNSVTLSQLYVAGFTGGQPITSDMTGITATNVYYDSSTTNKSSTTGVGEAKTTLELIESTTGGLGFGSRWRTDFSVSQRTNKTYPYLSWQTNDTQASMFFNSIDPMVDRSVTGNQVSVTLDLQNDSLRLFNPYSSGLASNVSSGDRMINRNGAARFSIGVINEQGVVGFTARRMDLNVTRQPAAGSSSDPVIDKTNFLEGESIVVTAPEANYGYRFDGFTVTGANSTITDLDLVNRTATFTMGTADATITANYQQTVIWTAEDLGRFLNSQAPFNREDETYSIEPVDGQTIDMSGEGEFIGRANFTGVLNGNNATIKNLTIRSGESSVGFIREITSGTARIEDLHFEGLTIDSTRGQSFTTYIGLIAQVGGGRTAELENISIDGTSQISANQPNGGGGLVGQNNGTTLITNSRVSGTLNTKTSNGLFGGFVGTSAGQLTIQDSLSRVNFTGGNNYSLNIGGFVGEASGQVSVIDSKSEARTTVNSTNETYRGGFIGRGVSSANITIQRSINSGDMRGNNSYVGGFIGRLSGTARIEESYHDGHVQGSTTSGIGAFIGISEGNGTLAISDSYSIGSSNGNGVIGNNQMNNPVTLSQLYVAGFTGGQPITSDTAGITATNIYYDSSTTNKSSTTGVGEAKTTLELIESTTNELGFGSRWRTDFSVSQRTNKTYPYLNWQTNNTQPSMFLNSINPMVDRPVSSNQVIVTLDLPDESLKLFNPYTAGLASNASSGERTINRNGAARFSIGVINPQGVVGFTARRMELTLTRDPLTGSPSDPSADLTNFIEGETTTIQAAEPSQGYRFVGFSVTGTGSTLSNIDQTNRTATFTMGTENATVTDNYVQTVIRTAADLSRFLNRQAPFDRDDENYSIEPEDGVAIDMANAGTFPGRQTYGAKLIGNHAVIRNLTLTSAEIDLGFIQSASNGTLRLENLSFENLNVRNTRGQSFMNYTAGLIGQINTGGVVELENIMFDGSTRIASNQSNGSGSLVGNNNGRLTIRNSLLSNSVHTHTSNGLLGGLVGRTTGTTTIERTTSRVRFTGDNNYSLNLGGLIGEASGTVTISDTQSESQSTIASASSTYRGGMIGFAGGNAQVLIERSVNSSDIRSANSYAGGFVGRALGNVTINESYHNGYMLGNVSTGSGGLVGTLEGNGHLNVNDSYSVGSTNGNGVIGVVASTATAQVNNLFVAGFTGGEPITNTTAGITAKNVYFDTTTTRKTSTIGIGEARLTTGLIDATISELGFGEKWLTGFALGSSANRTYPYLKWQTNDVQPSEFLHSIQPEVDRAVSTNQVTTTLDLAGQSVRLFNPYQADLPGNAASGTIQINRNNATRFSIGVINGQGVIGFTGIGNYTDIQPVSQVLNYGYEEKDYDAKDFVAVYKDHSETDDYEARFVSFPDSLNGSSARIEVSKNGTILATLDVPVTYQFGHSLNVRGISFQGTDIRAATLSLNSDQTEIVATYNSLISGVSIHSYFGNEMYYQITHYNAGTIANGPLNEQTSTVAFSANGSDRVGIMDSFGSNRRISVAKGEIVEIYHREASARLDNFQNNVAQSRSTERRSRYQITANGFERLTIDRLNPREQKTVLGMSHEDLERQVSRYLDVSQYPTLKIEGFSQYPDTSMEGNTNGKIVVSEELVNGQTVTWEYTVPFVVESDPAIHVTLPVKMIFDVIEEEVTSPDYQVINHSTTTNLSVAFHTKEDVELASTSNVVFLEEPEHAVQGEEAMLLYLQRLGEPLSDKPLVGRSSTFIGAQWTEIIQPDSQMALGFTGTYFGDTTTSNKVSGNLSLHFAAMTN